MTQFWLVYFLNNELIMVRNLDKIIPAWLNHVVHTLPLVACLMENLLTRHFYHKSLFTGSLPILIYSIFYFSMYDWYYSNGYVFNNYILIYLFVCLFVKNFDCVACRWCVPIRVSSLSKSISIVGSGCSHACLQRFPLHARREYQ